MPDFRLRDPDGGEHVTGDASERARLLGQGYTDIDDTDRDAGELAAPDDTTTDQNTATAGRDTTAATKRASSTKPANQTTPTDAGK